MEKIIRAVQESKQQKSGRAVVPPIVPPLEQQISLNSSRNQNIDVNEDVAKVEYEHTRVVELNNELLAKNRIVAFNKNNNLSLGFDVLRTQVIKKMLKNGWRTLAVTSPVPACGKTMVSINLGMSIAQHTNRTAILVDFDLRRPSVAKYLGLASGPSLNDVLAGEATISESLVNPGLERFVILPTAKPVSHSSEMISSRKVKSLITELRDRYDERIVIFDLPPLLGSDDAMIMLSQVDCVLVVIGNGMVSKTDITESMRYVDTDKLVGTVLNKSESEQSKRGYYDY